VPQNRSKILVAVDSRWLGHTGTILKLFSRYQAWACCLGVGWGTTGPLFEATLNGEDLHSLGCVDLLVLDGFGDSSGWIFDWVLPGSWASGTCLSVTAGTCFMILLPEDCQPEAESRFTQAHTFPSST